MRTSKILYKLSTSLICNTTQYNSNKGPETSLLLALVKCKIQLSGRVVQFPVEIVECIDQILPTGFSFSWEIFHDSFFYTNSLLILTFYFSVYSEVTHFTEIIFFSGISNTAVYTIIFLYLSVFYKVSVLSYYFFLLPCSYCYLLSFH